MRRRLRTVLVAGIAVGALAACTSNPGPRTVAEDIIDALPSCTPEASPGCLTDEQRTCMQEQLTATSDEELAAVDVGSQEGNYGPDFDPNTVSQAWRDFVARLEDVCGLPGSG